MIFTHLSNCIFNLVLIIFYLLLTIVEHFLDELFPCVILLVTKCSMNTFEEYPCSRKKNGMIEVRIEKLSYIFNWYLKIKNCPNSVHEVFWISLIKFKKLCCFTTNTVNNILYFNRPLPLPLRSSMHTYVIHVNFNPIGLNDYNLNSFMNFKCFDCRMWFHEIL